MVWECVLFNFMLKMLVDLNNYSTVIVLHWLDFFEK